MNLLTKPLVTDRIVPDNQRFVKKKWVQSCRKTQVGLS